MIGVLKMLALLLCSFLILNTSACGGPSLTPEETIWAFWHASMENRLEDATEYWDGLDGSLVAQMASVRDIGDEKREEFFELCSTEVLEENEELATVRWHWDLVAMLGEDGIEAVMYAGKEGKGFRKDEIGDLQRKLAVESIEKESTMDFKLENIRGRWRIVGYDFPLKKGSLY